MNGTSAEFLTIDILRQAEEVLLPPGQLGEGVVSPIRLRAEGQMPPPGVEEPNQDGVSFERLGVGELDGIVVAPETAAAPECGEA